ncbi:hypothetical protein NQ315_002007 [Exocentrus adspersus]|uniref:Lipase domain-containing protein n=1 Tax=Exocentrus adspersus TaxID=1586481 RepID=A0AAV8WAV3_9CUCU|nr:hypothetical protein NQ315_002007 [Exocentrus adspersus]
MSLLTQALGIMFNIMHLPFSLPGNGRGVPDKGEFSIFPFDTLRNMVEPCTTAVFKMGENEMKFTALPKGFCSNCCPVKLYRDVRFVLYTEADSNNGVAIEPMKPGAARRAGVNRMLPTIIFIHGFSEVSPGQSGRTVLDAYFSRTEKYNLILVDWSELGPFPWYGTAVMNVKYVGMRLKQFIEMYNDSGEMPVENLHIIGFSLGCHVAGIAGKLIRQGLRIPRITALDPALPEFSLNDTAKRLTASDANYVDVIHTDSGIFGFPISIGHSDFYPNGGRALQPGCQPSYLVKQRIVNQVLACSHVRAWRLYAESVKNEKAFPATKCSIWRGPNKQCDFSTDAYMGYANNK